MKIGVNALPELPSWNCYAELAKTCEQLGYDSFWTYDHLVSSAPDRSTLESLTTLAALAAVTSRITLGSLVLANEFRHPSIVAKSAATISSIAPSRFILGISAGSNADEHAAFGMPFPVPSERVHRLRESVGIIRDLLHGKAVTNTNTTFPMSEAQLHPAPDPPPPILVGARGNKMLNVVACLADMHVSAATPQEFKLLNARLDDQCTSIGRDPQSIPRCVIVYEAVADDSTQRAHKRERLETLFRRPFEELEDRVLSGRVEQVVERLDEYAAIGVDHLIVSAVPPYDKDFLTLFVEAAKASTDKSTLEEH